MERFERLTRWNAREDLIDEVRAHRGVEPGGIRHILDLLAHPDIIQETIKYFQGLDKSQQCLLYDAPWNCAREAEAKYENIRYGWTGGAGGIGFDASWCDPCRDKVLNNL